MFKDDTDGNLKILVDNIVNHHLTQPPTGSPIVENDDNNAQHQPSPAKLHPAFHGARTFTQDARNIQHQQSHPNTSSIFPPPHCQSTPFDSQHSISELNNQYLQDDEREFNLHQGYNDRTQPFNHSKNAHEDGRQKERESKPLITLSTNITQSQWFSGTGLPDVPQLELFYEETGMVFLTAKFPIVEWANLPAKQTCLPNNNMSHDSLKLIKGHLMNRITAQISPENLYLKAVIQPYALNQDGYGALFSIVFRCVEFLDEYKSGFGPTWEPHHEPSGYAAAITSKIMEYKINFRANYTEVEISLEMLSQAIDTNYKIATAIGLQHEIKTWDRSHKGQELSHRLQVCQLADALAKSNEKQNSEKIQRAVINAINQRLPSSPHSSSNNDRPYNKGKGRYEKTNLKKKLRCKSCNRFGHCIGVEGKPCNFLAQFYYAKKYSEAHPEDTEKNAEIFDQINQIIVNQLTAEKYEDYATVDEAMIEDLVIKAVVASMSSDLSNQ